MRLQVVKCGSRWPNAAPGGQIRLQVVKRGSGWSNAAPGGQTRRQVVKRAVLQALANGPGEALDRGGRGNPATSETSGISDESRMNLG